MMLDNLSLIGHLTELRKRLLWCLGAIVVLSMMAYFNAPTIINILIYPFQKVSNHLDQNHRFIYTNLPEVFLIQIKIAFWSGLITSFPIILIQLWRFIAPALYDNEKKFFLILLWVTPCLFLLGIACAYFIVIPNAWRFFLSFEQPATNNAMSILLEARISDYLNLTIQFLVVFGLSFQLPIIMILLCKLDIITLDLLKNSRRYAFIILLILSAFLTPPDVLSMFALDVPLYLLYEITLVILTMLQCNKVSKGSSRA